MSRKFLTDVDMLLNKVLNLVLELVAGDKTGPVEGQVWYDTVLQRIKLRRNSVTSIIPTLSTTNPPNYTIGQAAAVGSSTEAMRADALPGLPGLVTTTVDGFARAADKAKLDAATSAATASTIAMRDASGRLAVADPSAATDAVNRQYLEAMMVGRTGGKARVCTSSNVTLAGGAPNVVDGITLVAGDVVLARSQTAPAQNGIYSVTSLGTGSNGTWSRHADYDTWDELISAQIFIEVGTQYADTNWLCSSDRGGTLGTTAVNWVQLASSRDVTAGDGLVKDGNTLDVNPDNVGIEIVADQVALKNNGVTNSRLADMAANTLKGAVSAGDPADLTPAQARQILASDVANTSVARVVRFSVGNGSATSFDLTHSLGVQNVLVQVMEAAVNGNTVEADVIRLSTTVVRITFATAPTSNQYAVAVIA